MTAPNENEGGDCQLVDEIATAILASGERDGQWYAGPQLLKTSVTCCCMCSYPGIEEP